ncbi:MAG TPA: inosine/xanthosine triphosphatase [Candidatus Absconditabacterales bacterium]|nr:inosine/xanthosine triphosphatase [Candidatus Absconditabacterales bacterium]
MLIAIGSLRKPKLDAVEKAFQDCPYFGGQNIKYEARKTSSGVSDTPLNIEENMLGAKNRVKNLKKEISNADFYVGMEGGTSQIGDRYFLFGTTYIENNKGEGYYGFSPMMEIPDHLQKELYDNKKDLGVIIEEMSDRNDVKSNNGTLGELSDDMIKRAESFKISTQAAIAPFFNKYWKNHL